MLIPIKELSPIERSDPKNEQSLFDITSESDQNELMQKSAQSNDKIKPDNIQKNGKPAEEDDEESQA